MTYVWAVILGLVQGLAEFLPISSSAHLALVPWMFGLPKDSVLSSLQFDIMLHLGSGLAILVALWGDWRRMAEGAVRGDSFSRKLIGFLIVTSVPGALIGVAFESKAETVFRGPVLIAVALMVMGVVLWLVDHYAAGDDPFESMSWGRATVIGVAQAAAIVPGVSRSGITMLSGRALRLSREAIARYSFMAALPIILGAGVYGLRKVPVGTLLSTEYVLGFLAALVSSVVAMRWMLSFVRTRSLAVFAYYRIALGVVVLALFFLRG